MNDIHSLDSFLIHQSRIGNKALFANKPPSTGIIAPFKKDVPGVAINATTFAISSGKP